MIVAKICHILKTKNAENINRYLASLLRSDGFYIHRGDASFGAGLGAVPGSPMA